jgi:Recombination endonuclease VII
MADPHATPRKPARKISREPLSLFPETTRWCSKCSRHLPFEAFNRAARSKDGLHSHCRECHSQANKRLYSTRARTFAVSHIQRTYGLSPEEFAAMVAAQGNRCAICDRDMGAGMSRHIDHCHATGRLRGLLCTRCNGALGMAGDSPERLRAMADYIERYQTEP